MKEKKIGKLTFGIIILAILLGLYFFISNQEILPPTDIAGHIEKNPPSHILTTPMDIRVHKHMLEHADGKDRPGVIINYNCIQFECESDLLENLAKIVNLYPDFVYLAPYPNMTTKIAVSKYQNQITLERFNRKAIINFIEEE